MEVHLNPELQARVDRAAKANNRSPEEYVQQLVEHYVGHDVWFREQVKKGLDQLDRGEFPDPPPDGRSNRADVPLLNASSMVGCPSKLMATAR